MGLSGAASRLDRIIRSNPNSDGRARSGPGAKRLVSHSRDDVVAVGQNEDEKHINKPRH